MVVFYRMRQWYDHWLVLGRWKGSRLPRAFISMLVATSLNAFYHEILIPYRYGDTVFMSNPVGFTFFMQTAAFILSFATGICYNRFWEALGSLYQMSGAMGLAASTAMALGSLPQRDGGDELRWRAEILHDFSVAHAVCIQSLFTENIKAPLDILGGMTDWEVSELEGVKDQPALVFHWLHNSLVKRALIKPSPPSHIMSQMWNQLASAIGAYNNAAKLSKVPLPLSFQQNLAWADLVVVCFTPLCIAAYTADLYLSMALTFVVVLIYHGSYMADIAMQQPFGDKSTDLPLVQVHRDFTRRILSFINEEVADELNRYFDEHRLDDARLLVQQTPNMQALRPIGVLQGAIGRNKSEPLRITMVPPSPSVSCASLILNIPADKTLQPSMSLTALPSRSMSMLAASPASGADFLRDDTPTTLHIDELPVVKEAEVVHLDGHCSSGSEDETPEFHSRRGSQQPHHHPPVSGTKTPHLTTYRSVLPTDYTAGATGGVQSKKDSKRVSVASRISVMNGSFEGVFYGDKLLATEVVMPDNATFDDDKRRNSQRRSKNLLRALTRSRSKEMM